MAAAIIPLALSLAETFGPKIADLIAGLTHKHAPAVEAVSGPSTGPVKLADLFSLVIGDLSRAAVAGTIPKALPSDDIVRVVIQSVVSSMKLSGQLDAAAAPSTPGTVTLRAGQSLTITVA